MVSKGAIKAFQAWLPPTGISHQCPLWHHKDPNSRRKDFIDRVVNVADGDLAFFKFWKN